MRGLLLASLITSIRYRVWSTDWSGLERFVQEIELLVFAMWSASGICECESCVAA